LALIEELHIGRPVRHWFTNGKFVDGKIVGRRMNGQTQGEMDVDKHAYPSGKEPDRVKIRFQTIGVPPEYVSASESPDAVELL
jgi:hypothetical protein